MGLKSKRFAKRIRIRSYISKKGIGMIIGIKLSPWELRIYIAGIDIINGIISLMIPTKRKRILLNFPMNKRKISSKKKNLKKQYSNRYISAVKNLIV
jgi:hypothetical protein